MVLVRFDFLFFPFVLVDFHVIVDDGIIFPILFVGAIRKVVRTFLSDEIYLPVHDVILLFSSPLVPRLTSFQIKL